MKLRILLLIIALTTLAGCIKAIARNDVASMSEVHGNQVLAVGKIELIPPLKKNEQLLSKKTEKSFRDKAFVIYDDKKFNMHDLPISANNAASLVNIGKTFFLPIDRDKNGDIFFSGAAIVTYDGDLTRMTDAGIIGIYTALRTDHLVLPGAVRFKTKPSMETVYLGTIQFYRDEFNGITKIQIKDEFEKSREMVHQKYNGKTLHRVSAEKW